jgi:hypothetical protein
VLYRKSPELAAIERELARREKIIQDAERLRDRERTWRKMERKPLLWLAWSRPDTDPLLPAVGQAQEKSE